MVVQSTINVIQTILIINFLAFLVTDSDNVRNNTVTLAINYCDISSQQRWKRQFE